jgi:hypothetical protein
MILKKSDKIRHKKPSDVYRIIVNTSEVLNSTVVRSNSFRLDFENDKDKLEELRECIVALECCRLQYTNGKMSFESYEKLPYFEEYLFENWSTNHRGHIDLFENYRLIYFDKKGEKHNVDVTYDKEMVSIIKDCEIRI